MITANFIIDPTYLACHLIFNTASDRFVNPSETEQIVDFQNAAWLRDKTAYQFMTQGIQPEVVIGPSGLIALTVRANTLLDDIQLDPTFAPLLEQTEASRLLVQEEWEQNSAKSNEIIRELTGLAYGNDINVYLTHPGLKQGRADDGRVLWAHRLGFPNYNTVYLWHELLHIFLPGGDLEHAVIQLITDNEMRVRFNGGTYPPFEGHQYLQDLMHCILPHWQDYLKQEKKNIRSFIKQMAANEDVNNELHRCNDAASRRSPSNRS